MPGLNAPFGARCFLTLVAGAHGRRTNSVLMHLLALGDFRPTDSLAPTLFVNAAS